MGGEWVESARHVGRVRGSAPNPARADEHLAGTLRIQNVRGVEGSKVYVSGKKSRDGGSGFQESAVVVATCTRFANPDDRPWIRCEPLTHIVWIDGVEAAVHRQRILPLRAGRCGASLRRAIVLSATEHDVGARRVHRSRHKLGNRAA